MRSQPWSDCGAKPPADYILGTRPPGSHHRNSLDPMPLSLAFLFMAGNSEREKAVPPDKLLGLPSQEGVDALLVGESEELQRRPFEHFAARKMLGEVAKELGQGVVIIEG